MKSKKILGIIALLAIITIGIVAIIGCKEDEPDTSCKCANGTEHLFGQTCCGGTGCNCKVYYGVMLNSTIKIYKGEGVTDEQMTDAITNINKVGIDISGDDDLFSSFKVIIHSILVKTGNEVKRNGNIAEVGCEATAELIASCFLAIEDL